MSYLAATRVPLRPRMLPSVVPAPACAMPAPASCCVGRTIRSSAPASPRLSHTMHSATCGVRPGTWCTHGLRPMLLVGHPVPAPGPRAPLTAWSIVATAPSRQRCLGPCPGLQSSVSHGTGKQVRSECRGKAGLANTPCHPAVHASRFKLAHTI